MLRGWRCVVSVALAAGAGGVASSDAFAASASGRPAKFVAAAHERNDLTVGAAPGTTVTDAPSLTSVDRVLFSDASGPITPGLWCFPAERMGDVHCEPDGVQNGGAYGFVGPEIFLGDQDDRARLVAALRGGRPASAFVDGGSGNDRIENLAYVTARFVGGDGDDSLIGAQFAYGGAGADLIVGRPRAFSWAGYSDHDSTGVRVTLDDEPNDGSAGERDDVRTGNVIGSPGPDTVTGNDDANMIDGGQGGDTLVGAGGDDQLHGEAGADNIIGDAGNDLLDATLFQPGSFLSSDLADKVACGTGRDEVRADRIDKVSLDCEAVNPGLFGAPATLAKTTLRTSPSGYLTFTVRREASPSNTNYTATLRLLDRNGQAASSRRTFTFGSAKNVTRVRVRLNVAIRRRLSRSRRGTITLIAQREAHSSDPTTSLRYERFNDRLRIRRAARR